MLWARLGEASNLFTEYGVLIDSKCLANSSKVTKCLEVKRECGAQLVEQDHDEGRCFPLSSQDSAHSIFLISRLFLLGENLGLEGITFAWLPQQSSSLVILAAGTQNTSLLKCSCHGRQGIPVGDTCSAPCQQRKNSMLFSWILESPVPTYTEEATLQHLHPPSLHELHYHPILFIHPSTNKSKRQHTRSHFLARVCGV